MDNTHLESINFLTDIIQKCNIIDYNSDLQTLTDFARFSHISRCNYALVHFFLSIKEIHYFFLYPSITRQIQFYRTHSYISMPISVVRLWNQISNHFLQCSTLPNSKVFTSGPTMMGSRGDIVLILFSSKLIIKCRQL